jgi:hypothetical protein
MVKAYHKRLNSDNEEERLTAARAWTKWELRFSHHFVILSPILPLTCLPAHIGWRLLDFINIQTRLRERLKIILPS